jgi:hypothetical protein
LSATEHLSLKLCDILFIRRDAFAEGAKRLILDLGAVICLESQLGTEWLTVIVEVGGHRGIDVVDNLTVGISHAVSRSLNGVRHTRECASVITVPASTVTGIISNARLLSAGFGSFLTRLFNPLLHAFSRCLFACLFAGFFACALNARLFLVNPFCATVAIVIVTVR